MPTYDTAARCGNPRLFRRSPRILKACPTCGNGVTRLISSNVGSSSRAQVGYCVDNRKSSSKESAEGAACSADSCNGSSSDSCPCSSEAKVS